MGEVFTQSADAILTGHLSDVTDVGNQYKRYSLAVDSSRTKKHVTFQNDFRRGDITEDYSECPQDVVPPELIKRRFTKQQWIFLCCMILLDLTSYAMMSIIAPFFPDVILSRDLSSTINGLVFSVFAFVLFIASPIVGMLIPHFPLNTFYMVGILLAAVANILFGLIPLIEDNLLFVSAAVLLRSIEAMGAACFLTLTYCLIPSIFPNDVNTVTGILETAVGVGCCLGPAIGVWTYSLGGFFMPFVVLGGFLLLMLPTWWVIMPRETIQPSTEVVNFCSIFSRVGVVLPTLILFVVAFCQSGLYPTLQPHMGKLGVSVQWVGMVFLLNSAVYSVASPLIGLAVDRWRNPYVIMVTGLLLTSLALILLGNSPLLPRLKREELVKEDIIAIVILGVSVAMCIVPTYSVMLDSAKGQNQNGPSLPVCAIIGGIWSSSYSLGDMVGPLYTAVMANYTTFAVTTTYTACLPVVMMVILVSIGVVKKILRQSETTVLTV